MLANAITFECASSRQANEATHTHTCKLIEVEAISSDCIMVVTQSDTQKCGEALASSQPRKRSAPGIPLVRPRYERLPAGRCGAPAGRTANLSMRIWCSREAPRMIVIT